MSVRELLITDGLSLTPSEQKIVRLLLTDYPTSGLGTVSRLARRAGVSDPTVVRLVIKLGFESFADFQAKLLAEVEERVHSPLHMMEAKRLKEPSGIAFGYMNSVEVALTQSQALTPAASYDHAARLIMEAKGSVTVLGGRFSRFAAGMLHEYLRQMRSDVRSIFDLSASAFDTLVDLGRKDVLVVFDYRRYQQDVTSFARQARQQEVRLILFTDQWLSPIAEIAEVAIISRLDVASPFDTMAPAIAQMEAVVANILSIAGDEPASRMQSFEKIRAANGITIDDPAADGVAR
ncbi:MULTISPECIES: MurR/RpiR family transcriptional regulator [Rhizobium/Agrobacterium group]|uniref:MurR/RpiR family transcriptional regulator n=1 Tax=Agrobacterium rosae TaxID=1972867 RepID=UPI0020348434|nr:MurR/RpiR family transcriptional regulator [Agrobacterium rosae]MCM2436080.1 MurR/RpiR family transcriptional regulator [Agrobacterium rosae]